MSGDVPPPSDPASDRAPTLICEFPFRIRLDTLFKLTGKILEEYSEVVGDVVLEVNGDRERLCLSYYPTYQEGLP